MSSERCIDEIIKKRLNNIKKKRNWGDGLTEEECKTYNRYYIKQLRLTPEKQHQEKQYREENKDKIKEKDKEYREKNIETIKEREKKYREENKEKIKEYNANRIRPEGYEEKRKEKAFCECGCWIRKDNIGHHKKTQKHEQTLEAKKALETSK